MKYVCLCYEEEEKLERMTEGEWSDVVRETYEYNADLQRKGQLISSEALDRVATASTVRVRNGSAAVTDGPFAETKEQLGGFFLIEANDLDEAIRVASGFAGARIGCIEVRPTRQLR